MIRNIAFVVPSLSAGGAERVVVRLATALAADFNCFVFIRKGAVREYPVDGLAVVEIDFTEPAMLAAIARYGIDLVSEHYHWNPDHVAMMARIAAAGVVPVILTEHNVFYYPLFQAARQPDSFNADWFGSRYDHYRHFAAVTVLNAETRDLFADRLDNVCLVPNPVSYEPNGVADYHARTLVNVSHFRKKAKRLDLLYAGFAGVAAACPGARLRVVDEYCQATDRILRKSCSLEQAAIQCTGRSSMVAHHYNRSTVFGLSSEIEGQPMVLLEAALHAMPQVVFDISGIRDQVVDGETGFVVPFGDTGQFADRVASLLLAPRLARRMGENAREFVRREFAVERVAASWRALIARIGQDGRWTTTRPAREAAAAAALAATHERNLAYWAGVARHRRGVVRPQVSFLVPVYGTEAYLARCLRSIQAQTLQDFECIVVDDASPGDVAAVMAACVGDDERFRLVRHDRNRGLYQARSTAALAAAGLYFAHVDSDDYIHERFAEVMVAEAVTTDSEIVECGAVELEVDGRPFRFNTNAQVGAFDGNEATAAYFNARLRNVVWNKLYARDLWFRVGGHNDIDAGITVAEDTLRNAYLFPAARRYSFVKDCLYFYCRRTVSVVRGGGLDALARKLDDIGTSYAYARAHLIRDLGHEDYCTRMERRQARDVAWYIGEHMARFDWPALQADMAASVDDAGVLIGSVLAVVRAHQETQDAMLAMQRRNSVLWDTLVEEQAKNGQLREKIRKLTGTNESGAS